jgi:hypothetical protein
MGKLVQGVRNNQPEILTEWRGMTRNEQKFALRNVFGRADGDQLRRLGWSAINLGPLTQAMLTRFMIKLAKALYYRHVLVALDDYVYVSHINIVSKDTTPEFMEGIMAKAPTLPTIRRNNASLIDQFIYRFNCSVEHGMIHAVVQFGEQYVFQLIALTKAAASGLALQAERNGMELPTVNRFDCFLEPHN